MLLAGAAATRGAETGKQEDDDTERGLDPELPAQAADPTVRRIYRRPSPMTEQLWHHPAEGKRGLGSDRAHRKRGAE